MFDDLKAPYRSPYQMQHTFATLMLKRGENILWIAHMLGHSNLTMLQKHYARWIDEPDERFETANDWSSLLSSTKSAQKTHMSEEELKETD